MKTTIFTMLAAGMLLVPGVSHAERAEVGQLDCDVSAGIGAIVGTRQDLACTFTPSGNAPVQHYIGNITEFGLDVGTVDKGRMVWLVYNATREPVGGLQGTYDGVTAGASLGVGADAEILVGGSLKSLSLQPLAVDGDTGLNLAVGVTSLELRLAP
ncbi:MULTISPECIES: DUF992 domain-containing protein [unclassified Rhizobium]|uniref:DUF992 domain-containing protein n=1 Tax=unclassified Rhizobium TaxID=2613769 RepID=UPI00161DE775|nr:MULTISPECIES: DUF992 domain-containing protein [unclassified Rhizobium]MBB3286867.1 hypothetical protein [Rhizobium sp. BK252]MBB3401607.1 hypothetical protein [Rhizobium sp. BK289]MBB3414449.1 hypothetical protein [Rhizobium sp. BK284]MBB3482337.1 hypothetical protein [Rhizobium sp. BK347]MDK4718362.1 DUF992 domain-containing protein [Rhizobium sp. CNPSo 3968]